MKVVINRCHGGFGLSDEAFELLLAKKNIEWEKVDTGKTFGFSRMVYYRKGHANEDEHYLSDYDFYDDRSDRDLIEVVETIGSAANGWAAELKVVEIPDDVEWDVDEYDGLEWVAERHRTWC